MAAHRLPRHFNHAHDAPINVTMVSVLGPWHAQQPRIDHQAGTAIDGAAAASKSQLMLEVIDKGSGSRDHPVPLLFVHGGWHGAWCWDDHFLDYFAGAGYRTAAISLGGHGGSPTAKRLAKVSIADYLDEVESVADQLGGRPVLIGHSWAASWSSATSNGTALRPRCCWVRCRRRACSAWRYGCGAAGRR